MAKSKADRLSPAQEARLLETISELVLKGFSVRQISAKVKVLGPTAIHNRIKSLEEEWLKEAERNFAMHRGRLLSKLRMVQLNAWKMFIKSCKNYKEDSKTNNFSMQKVSESEGGVEIKDLMLSTVTEHTQGSVVHGNPKYLSIVVDCVEKEAKLLGVYDWVSKEINEDGAGSGVAEIYLNQQVYIPGVGAINPELLTPEIWEALHSILIEQDPHHYGGDTQ